MRPGEIERTIVQAVRSRPGATAILVVLDADDDCPVDVAADLMARAGGETELPVRVVVPKVEIEAWVLASIESVRGVRGICEDAAVPLDPEAIRDAKGALSRLMDGARGYVATDDLPAFFAAIDLDEAATRSPSFAKFRRDIASAV